VEALAGDKLVDGADVWTGGVELAGLLDDDGDVDAAKVEATIAALVQAKPHYAQPRGPRPDPSQGARGEHRARRSTVCRRASRWASVKRGLHVCPQSGCGTLIRGRYCSAHSPVSPRKRGYTSAHDRERARWVAIVAAGGVPCARCGVVIVPVEPWDLDHADDRLSYLGPSHRACNRRTSTRRADGEAG
jgi:hypothetical protein